MSAQPHRPVSCEGDNVTPNHAILQAALQVAVRLALAEIRALVEDEGQALTVARAIGLAGDGMAALAGELRRQTAALCASYADHSGSLLSEGMLWLDAAIANALEGTGNVGKDHAGAYRERARARVRTFLEGQGGPLQSIVDLFGPLLDFDHADVPRALVLIGQLLWDDAVRARVDEAARKPPTYGTGYIDATSRGLFAEGRAGGPAGEILDKKGGLVAVVNPAVGLSERLLSDKGLRSSANLAAHAIFRIVPYWTYQEALKQGLDLGYAVPALVVEGGLAALAKKLGLDPKHTRPIRDALDLLQGLHAVGEDGAQYHGLCTWTEYPAAPGQPARIEIVPSRALMAGGGRGKLVPVPHRLPRFAGSRSTFASQALLQLLVLRELRSWAIDLAQTGAVTITPARWRELGEAAGVPAKTLHSLLSEVWITDHVEDGPAFLRHLGGDLWALGPDYRREQTVIVQGGAWDLAASVAGRKSARKRLGQVRRHLPEGLKRKA